MANKVPTQWFDLQVKHGNYLPLQKQATLYEIQSKMKQQHQQKNSIQNIIASKQTKDQLDQMQDQFDMDDEFTKQYMQKRMNQIKQKAQNYKYGKVMEISRDEYIRQVTNADPQSFVVLHLYATSNQFCSLLNKHLPFIAQKYPKVKFIKIQGNKCINNYPDINCPTFIFYKAGKVLSNLTNVDKLMKNDVNHLEILLRDQGIIKLQQ